MANHWAPFTPIETLFTQLKTYKRFAAEDNDPIADTQVVRTGVQIIESNDIFDIVCHEWRVKTYISCTMVGFKIYFRKVE